jgi:glycine cleavage system regulatory protein
VPANVSLDVLRGDLDVLANELVVDLSLNERG